MNSSQSIGSTKLTPATPSDEGAAYTEDAVAEVLRQTGGYPYFLQEWGKHCWNVADELPIDLADALQADIDALAELDASFFRVRFDRLTPTKSVTCAPWPNSGPARTVPAKSPRALGQKVSTVAPLRNTLIAKGMLYSPAHGDTAFTVPLFDAFMKRIMPQVGG